MKKLLFFMVFVCSLIQLYPSAAAYKKKFVCDVCGKTARDNAGLRCHQTVHTGVKLFQCSLCQKSFAEKSGLMRHQTVHTGAKLFQCYVCQKKFAQRFCLMRHKKIHTRNELSSSGAENPVTDPNFVPMEDAVVVNGGEDVAAFDKDNPLLDEDFVRELLKVWTDKDFIDEMLADTDNGTE